jgi:hypothetical protein
VTLLIVTALLYGAAAGFAFTRLTDHRRIRQAVNQIQAHIMEFRLFIDEPGLIWKAQREALRANLSLLRLIALPTALMAILFALAWQPMERRFGHGPLKLGESTIMTAHTDLVPCFAGLIFDTPGVYLPRTGETVWRVHLTRELKGPLPPGVELRYPRSNVWLAWFAGISTLSAIAAANLPTAFPRGR